MMALGAGLLAAAVAEGGGAVASIRTGGTFRISIVEDNPQLHLDPALSYEPAGWALLDLTCARLMNYPDKRPPEGFRLVPEVAARYPRISRDGRTYTFVLRRSFRFSNGAPVRASAFARGIARVRALSDSPGTQYTRDIARVSARGNRVVVRLTRFAPDFPARTTMPFFCAVPPTLPVDPEGRVVFPAAGPYYVAEYLRGRRILLRQNRFYGGRRPRHVDRFEVDLRGGTFEEVLDRVERGQADWGWVPPAFYFDPSRRLAAKYGVNRSRFFVQPGLGLNSYALNTSRPLFRNNVRLRRAVNFAVDRSALRRVAGGRLARRLTDQYLPPNLPGYRDAQVYPLGRPNLTKARSLARGQTRGGKAVLYTFDLPVPVAAGQVVKRNLARIGLDVEVKAIPPPAYFDRISSRTEPFDIAFLSWSADYIDPYSYVNLLLERRFVGATNYAHFRSPRFDRLMRRAAGLRGRARYAAYGRLDVRLAREAAPMVAVGYDNDATLVSRRVDPRCIVLRPTLVLTAVCLKG